MHSAGKESLESQNLVVAELFLAEVVGCDALVAQKIARESAVF